MEFVLKLGQELVGLGEQDLEARGAKSQGERKAKIVIQPKCKQNC